MSNKRLLLLSGSREGKTSYLEHAETMLCQFLGNTSKNLVFIPYAGVSLSYDDYENKVSDIFSKLGFNLKSLHKFKNHGEAIESADALIVGGGNTFALLNKLYSCELLDLIRKRVNTGTPYIGWSAGSNLAGKTIRTTNDMPIIEPPSFNALKLENFQINPHFISGKIPGHNGESREERLQEFLTLNPNTQVVALPEGSALNREGSNIQVIGSKPVTIFSFNENPVLIQPNDLLNDFINT